jgi:hypothetical protein
MRFLSFIYCDLQQRCGQFNNYKITGDSLSPYDDLDSKYNSKADTPESSHRNRRFSVTAESLKQSRRNSLITSPLTLGFNNNIHRTSLDHSTPVIEEEMDDDNDPLSKALANEVRGNGGNSEL